MRALGELQKMDPANLRKYLEACIRNRIRDEIRRAKLGEVASRSSCNVSDSRPGPFEDAVDSQERTRFRRGLERLSPRDQLLIVGRLELGLSWDELSLASGYPTVQAARSATRRAMSRLARQMMDTTQLT